MATPATIGRLAVVLHTHMPAVLGRGVWPFGEQWLWETIGHAYLRVGEAVRGHPVTIGVTPVLADQFEALAGADGERFGAWVADSREYCFGEDMAAFLEVGRPDLHAALAPQIECYRRAAERFDGELGRDLNAYFRGLADDGAELIGGPATHAILPLLATDTGLDLQLAGGLASHARRFGAGGGVWLPECAFERGVDKALARHGVRYFCVDQSGVYGADALENLEPLATPAGPLAIPIDWHTIAQVWGEGAYPAAPSYRSTFARTIHDLLPYDNAGEAWNPARARAQAEAHAEVFLRALAARLEFYAGDRGRPGTIVFATDTELFGHWWFEGPWFLEAVLGRAAAYGVELVTLEQLAADARPDGDAPVRSSWGRGKTLETWDSPKVADLVYAQRRAELDFERALRGGTRADRDALERAREELLLLQSSDWAFMESWGMTGSYGSERAAGHLAAFESALELRGN